MTVDIVQKYHAEGRGTRNKTVHLVYENKYFQLDKDLIPQVLLVQVVLRLNDNNEWNNPFHVPVEIEMT